MDDSRHLVLITGATGSLGRALMNAMQTQSDVLCVGVSRNEAAVMAFNSAADKPCNSVLYQADISKPETITPMMRDILSLPGIRNVTLIHALGPFKYDGYATMEEAVWRGVDPATLYLHALCMEDMAQIIIGTMWERSTKAHPAHIRLCTFGSISEPYNVPLWHSFNEAKKRVHGFLREQTAASKDMPGINLCSLYARTASFNSLSLNSEEVARCTISYLDQLPAGIHLSLDLMRPLPGFDAANYYGDTKALHDRWWARLAENSL